jgi:DNA-binding transcriptional regulator GbsR (MarR family)
MTRRERLEMVIRGEINEELIADCKRELEKLDVHRTHARENQNYSENKEVEERIYAALLQASEPVQIDELAELVGSTFARQRLTAICTNLIREGRIRSCDVKTKKGKRKGYYI